MKPTPGCPCEEVVHPKVIRNPPGLSRVDYRAGDYVSFRQALLSAGRDETALERWRPTAAGDLALQLVEWWAYLADILTFYNERAIQEVLLRTAELPEDVRRIIRLLGYRPRPGIAATGVVAAIPEVARLLTLPRGLAIQGTTPPGDPEQVFELDEDVEIGRLGRRLPASARFRAAPGAPSSWTGPAPRDARGRFIDSLPAKAPPPTTTIKEGEEFTVAFEGVITTVKADDVFVVLRRDWTGHTLAQVKRLEHTWDSTGRAITQLTALAAGSMPGSADQASVRLMRATKLAHLWLYQFRYPGSTNPSMMGVSGALQVVESIIDPLGILFGSGPPKQPPQDPRPLAGLSMSPSAVGQGAAHLEAITRGISPGDPVLFEKKVDGPFAAIMLRTQLVKVIGYSEEIWYANAPQMDQIGQAAPVGPPTSSMVEGITGGADAPIPIPHTRITFLPNGFLDIMAGGLDQLDIDKIVLHYGWQEVGRLVEPPPKAPTETVEVPALPDVPPDVFVPALIEDAAGSGTTGFFGWSGGTEGKPLRVPLKAYPHLLPISRGQTVAKEILGNGDPILVGQEFVLKRSPLTYLADTGPRSIDGRRSTLQIRVDGIEWHEVPSFYGVPAVARVFVTREDEEQKTHVRFGDGENGARLPAGVDNVVARYRYGSGASVPPVGTLTTILTPQPGLSRIVNPVPPGGGSDPDPPDQIRRYAPQSVLTFGRAVSGDDFEALAAQTPGVRRARAVWSWDSPSQRTLVKVFVGDDAAAVTNAREALAAFADPNVPVLVELAAPVHPDLTFTITVDPDHVPDAVADAVARALLDPRDELFGAEAARIGRTVYDSQIGRSCLRVPGVVAVRALRFSVDGVVHTSERHSPGERGFYVLLGNGLHISAEVARHGQ